MDADHHQEIARCLFRESNDALFLFDPQSHRVIDLNPVAVRLTGFEKKFACTKTVWDLFSGDAGNGLEPIIEAYRNTGFYHSREGFHLSRRKGEKIPVNVSVSRIHTSPSPIGLVIARDVTERKKAEEALRESEAKYRGLVETARVIFWTVDGHDRITSLNPQWTAITGWDCTEWIGRDLKDLVGEGDQSTLEDLLKTGRKGEPLTQSVDVHVTGKTGEPLVIEFLSAAIFLGAGPGGVSGIARDVTDLRRAAEGLRQTEALRSARIAAEAADRAKSEFLAHVSHEIRTPMTSILGYIDMLLRDESVQALSRHRLEDLRTIEQNGHHLLALIDDILDISRIEAGKLPIEKAECSPLLLATDVVALFQQKAASKGLAFVFTIRGEVPAKISTDALRLRQILINLVGNALKFTDEGTVLLSMDAVGRETETPTLAIEVADTGVGMTEAEIAELFKPFSQPSRLSERQTGGTGLGLAISLRLARMLGGTIRVASTPGQGSRFRLELPIGSRSAIEWVRSLPEPVGKPSRREADSALPIAAKILLAEDNPAIQRMTLLHLEQLGATVAAAKNGQEALDKALAASAEGRPFDVVLMDMQMPVVDGYEATRLLRAGGYQGSIIALTAYAMAEDREECLRLGCNEHISKPIDWARLNEVLARLLSQPS